MLENFTNIMRPEVFAQGICGIIFDVDGVLFNSRVSNITYYNTIRESLCLPPLNAEEEDYCTMATTKEAFHHIIPAHQLQDAYAIAKKINYADEILPMLIPEDGLLEALHWLKSWNINLGICTNRSNSVDVLLHYFGLQEFFNPIKTAENTCPKPSPQGLLETATEWQLPLQQLLFIGDSKVDEQAATAARIPFCSFNNPRLTALLHTPNFFSLISSITPFIEKVGEDN